MTIAVENKFLVEYAGQRPWYDTLKFYAKCDTGTGDYVKGFGERLETNLRTTPH